MIAKWSSFKDIHAMNSPRARIANSNGQGLDRPPLRGWRFQPEIDFWSAWAERGARRSTNSMPAITHTNTIAIDRFSETTALLKFKEFEIRRATTEIGLRNIM